MTNLNKSQVRDFLKEIENLYKKYNLSISHEDGHGSFLIEDFDEFNMEWLKSADYGEWEE